MTLTWCTEVCSSLRHHYTCMETAANQMTILKILKLVVGESLKMRLNRVYVQCNSHNNYRTQFHDRLTISRSDVSQSVT